LGYHYLASDKVLTTQNTQIFGNTLVKVKVKFTLEQPTKAHKGSRGIALLFL